MREGNKLSTVDNLQEAYKQVETFEAQAKQRMHLIRVLCLYWIIYHGLCTAYLQSVHFGVKIKKRA
jgi:hypothetical protein